MALKCGTVTCCPLCATVATIDVGSKSQMRQKDKNQMQCYDESMYQSAEHGRIKCMQEKYLGRGANMHIWFSRLHETGFLAIPHVDCA